MATGPVTTSNFWTVPHIWDGDTVFIIGGGPSLIGFDASCILNRRVIAVNCAFKLGQFDAMFYGDPLFPNLFGQGLDEFAGLKITTRDEHLGRPGIRVVLRNGNAYGLSLKPDTLHWNLSSGACAINLAVLLGAGKIVLLGFDMHQVDGRNNFHTDYLNSDGSHAAVGDYHRMASRFPAIAKDLEKLCIPCLNACPTSSLDCFPKVTIEEALQCA